MGRTAVGELCRIVEGARASCRIVLPPEIRLKGPAGTETASGGEPG